MTEAAIPEPTQELTEAQAAMFARGDIDAAWVPEPWGQRLVTESGATLLAEEKDLWPDKQFLLTLVVTTPDFLAKHPDVVQAYVVGVPDPAKGEAVAAAVELRTGAAGDTAPLLAFCRERLASYKVPTRLVVRAAAEFPRTATGKIHKPGLRQELST